MIQPYLVFDGNAKEAIAYYASAFGVVDYDIMTFGDAPNDPEHPLPAAAQNLVMHAALQLPNAKLMFSDNYPGSPYSVTIGNNITLAFAFTTKDAMQRAFELFADGGQVHMVPAETFFSPFYANVVDRYGVEWQLTVEDPDTR